MRELCMYTQQVSSICQSLLQCRAAGAPSDGDEPLLARPEAAGHHRLLVTLERHGRFAAAAGDLDAAREAAREAVAQGLRWDAPALVGMLRAGGHVARARARARPLLLDILRGG